MSISAKRVAAGIAAVALSGGILLGAAPAFAAPTASTSAAAEIVLNSATVVSVDAGKVSLKLSTGASATVKVTSGTKITGSLVAGVKVKVLCVQVDGSLVANTVVVL
ncbi:hypothetical protein [Allokutzneria oryzae]|uniref:DUF5666 domain-containing protein n=1 Tax=Allokutzneria oryzae TaxID=1378989 RepID=A0ABV6A1E7_9PSEU